jgi:HAD superfamily hydrolase (TIGR01456 family)
MKFVKGVALDIDGVLLRGGKVIRRAPMAMELLESAKIPYVFVTNGGGMREEAKSRELSKKLNVCVRPEQVILSHSPFRDLVMKYHNKRVLILGRESCIDVARSYGFRKAVSVKDLHEENRTVYPLRKPIADPSSTEKGERVDVAMIFHDPVDWGIEMQVLFDALVGHLPVTISSGADGVAAAAGLITHESNLEQRIPLYASNADIVYKSEHPFPRFTQGAFVETFRHLFELYTGSKLQVNYCGKPFPIQYEAAAEQLCREAVSMGLHTPMRYYGIGDNPKADVRGANGAGENWTSILVRTGVFVGKENDPTDPADFVCEDIYDAVQYIISDNVLH